MPQGLEARTRLHRSCVAIATGVILALALVIASARPASAAPTAPVSSSSAEGATADAAQDYWTPQRLRRAESVDPANLDSGSLTPPIDASAQIEPPLTLSESGATSARTVDGDRAVGKRKITDYPYRVHGKIFGTTPGEGDYSCSGTVIGSNGKNVVFTAGHCVFDRATDQFSINVVFIPGYRKGKTPFGEYPASDLWILNGWKKLNEERAFSYDVAAVQLNRKVERQVGSRGIRFNVKRKRTFEIFGYPSRPGPYDGERLIRCPKAQFLGRESGPPFAIVPNPSIIAGPCFMQQGSSGGGWVVGKGFVNSVVSHGFCDVVPDLCGLIHGPPFDAGAKRLYAAVGGGKRRPTDSADCKKAKQRHAKAKRARKRAKQALKRAKRKGSANLGPKKRRYKQAKRKSRRAKQQLNERGC